MTSRSPRPPHRPSDKTPKYYYLFDVASDRAGHNSRDADQRSKLIVLEDAGELMLPDARSTAGQGLSRLLNLTDGLIGQGLKVLILITTNEPLSALHPAVIRPGRCLAEIEFGPLPSEEANTWLADAGSPALMREPATLAELYAVLGGEAPRPKRRPVGFAVATAA